MTDARALIAKIRTDLGPVEKQILGHRYLDALEAGRIGRGQLRSFAGHQHHIIASDLRSIAALLARHGHLASRAYLMNVLAGEASALDALVPFASALGMDEGDLRAFEPEPAGIAYCAYLAWLGAYGSDAELAAAFYVNFGAWGANCGRMGRALKDKLGFTDAELGFFELFANAAPSEETVAPVIQDGLERGIGASAIHRAARLVQGFELMFWDAMAELAGV